MWCSDNRHADKRPRNFVIRNTLRHMSGSKQTPDEAFKMFTRRVGVALREHGFKGSGQNYRRDCGSQWQAINIQKSSWRVGRDDPVVFYVNIGLQFPNLTFERYAEPPATVSKFVATKADQDFRIDELFPNEQFDWFVVAGIGGQGFDRFCTRFESLIRDRLVSLLDTLVTPEGLARVIRTMPWVTTLCTREFLGPDLSPPNWDPVDNDAGRWKKDDHGRWWGPGEW